MGEEFEFTVDNIYLNCNEQKIPINFQDSNILYETREEGLPLIIPTKEYTLECTVSDELMNILIPSIEYDDIENKGVYMDITIGENTMNVKFINVPEEYLKLCGNKFYKVIFIICNKLYKEGSKFNKPIDIQKELNKIWKNRKYVITPDGKLEIVI